MEARLSRIKNSKLPKHLKKYYIKKLEMHPNYCINVGGECNHTGPKTPNDARGRPARGPKMSYVHNYNTFHIPSEGVMKIRNVKPIDSSVQKRCSYYTSHRDYILIMKYEKILKELTHIEMEREMERIRQKEKPKELEAFIFNRHPKWRMYYIPGYGCIVTEDKTKKQVPKHKYKKALSRHDRMLGGMNENYKLTKGECNIGSKITTKEGKRMHHFNQSDKIIYNYGSKYSGEGARGTFTERKKELCNILHEIDLKIGFNTAMQKQTYAELIDDANGWSHFPYDYRSIVEGAAIFYKMKVINNKQIGRTIANWRRRNVISEAGLKVYRLIKAKNSNQTQ